VIELIAFAIVGYVEIGPGKCQIDYLQYDKLSSVIMPCSKAYRYSVIPIEEFDYVRGSRRSSLSRD